MGYSARTLARHLALIGALAMLAAGCGGAFGVGDNTNPGNTPNIPAQTSFRVVGDAGTPFVATISDARSSWVVYGIVPESLVVVNNLQPDRIMVTKLANDARLLSLEIIGGLNVKVLSSTTENYGVVVGAVNGGKVGMAAFAPRASPDVRFFVKGPMTAVFNATIEDLTNSNILQARVPAVILFDSPNGGSSGRVDGIFSEVNFFGPFDVDLLINGTLAQNVIGGTTTTVKGSP